jgi:maltooligosyltrehalose trehalohydrolase
MNNFGTHYQENGTCLFTIWAPLKDKMTLHLLSSDRLLDMKKEEEGYFQLEVSEVSQDEQYLYTCVEGEFYPDPASHYQPEGVFGPSQIVTHESFVWNDKDWKGIPFKELILYELHVGTFTPEGTFEAIIPLLDDLIETGINAIQLMPVNQFPGSRDWGYDGTFLYAVQNSYGGPQGLKRLVDACHQKGMAVYLDVVYNHIGPEGNYLDKFAPYFTKQYTTPWGEAINFDGAWSDGVRDFFSNNILYWFTLYHLDGLRCDAVHMMFDTGAVHFWELVNEKLAVLKAETGRLLYLVAESDFNSPRIIQPPSQGGWGFQAQWLDDFHHALYVLLDPKGIQRYGDFGRMAQLAKAYTDGFVHSGEYVHFRKKKYGRSSSGINGEHFVAFNLNHDQAGNRVRGERLSMLVNFDRLKIAAAALLLAPYVPMLFMGEEYGEDVPFFYFVNYADENLKKAVIEGRIKEFENFNQEGEVEDPNSIETFNQSKIQWHKRNTSHYAKLLSWHRLLINLRKTSPVLKNFSKEDVSVDVIDEKGFVLYRASEDKQEKWMCLFNLSEETISYTVPDPLSEWSKILDSNRTECLEDENQQPLLSKDLLPGGMEMVIPPLNVLVYALIS